MDERYTAVVFSSQRRTGPDAEHDGYEEMAARMFELASRQPGYRGIESVRGPDGRGITVAYFDSDQHARNWKQHPEHLEAQRLGRERWYESYELRIAECGRELRMGSGRHGSSTSPCLTTGSRRARPVGTP